MNIATLSSIIIISIVIIPIVTTAILAMRYAYHVNREEPNYGKIISVKTKHILIISITISGLLLIISMTGFNKINNPNYNSEISYIKSIDDTEHYIQFNDAILSGNNALNVRNNDKNNDSYIYDSKNIIENKYVVMSNNNKKFAFESNNVNIVINDKEKPQLKIQTPYDDKFLGIIPIDGIKSYGLKYEIIVPE